MILFLHFSYTLSFHFPYLVVEGKLRAVCLPYMYMYVYINFIKTSIDSIKRESLISSRKYRRTPTFLSLIKVWLIFLFGGVMKMEKLLIKCSLQDVGQCCGTSSSQKKRMCVSILSSEGVFSSWAVIMKKLLHSGPYG